MLTILLLAMSFQAAGQGQAQSVILGFGDCTPALFTSPAGNTRVAIREITYETGVPLGGYTQEIRSPRGQVTTARITVNRAAWKGMCTSLLYSVEIGGRRLDSPTPDAFEKTGRQDALGFTAEGIGGAVVRSNGPLGQGGFETQFAYDEEGRRAISRQTFALGTAHYEIVYSSYTYDDLGRLRSYVADIKVAK